MKIKRIEIAVLCGLLVAILAGSVSGFTTFAANCGEIRQDVLRLHILANSDSAADQALKLKVRDRLLTASPELFGKAADKAQAIEQAGVHLDEIRTLAQDEVVREGYTYRVDAKIVYMYFTTRTYSTGVTMPAGWYDALRITIGAAKGHNWWCVMFPPLCLPAAEDSAQTDDVFNADQQSIIRGGNQPQYKIEFKCLEWLEDIKNFFTK